MGFKRPRSTMHDGVDINDSNVILHVKKALQSVGSGDCDDYNLLVGVMHHNKNLTPDEVAMLVTCLRALTGSVSYLNVFNHKSLLSAIYRMRIWDFVAYGSDVMDALGDLIVSLATLDGIHMEPCLTMLVNNFTPPGEFNLKRKEKVFSLVHEALKRIAHLVPQAPMNLLDILLQKIRKISNDYHLILMFMENIFRLVRAELFREFIGSDLLLLVVDILVDNDVKIEWGDIYDTKEGIFEMELEVMGEGADFDKISHGTQIAQILDSLMVMTFQQLGSYENLVEVFDTLLESFCLTILKTEQLRAAQFVMFYACALDPAYCGVRFATRLADIFVGSIIPFERENAVAYLASYLSRAKFLSLSFTADMLERLVDWCLEYCKTWNGNSSSHANDVFYHGCQAILYVLCFRMRPMVDVPRLKQLIIMPLEKILKHKLNPLKKCLPYVVEEFLQQAKAANLFTVSDVFAFDYFLLESQCPRTCVGPKGLGKLFPFDPCFLKNCNSFIHDKYVYWSMVETTSSNKGSSDDDDLTENSSEEEHSRAWF